MALSLRHRISPSLCLGAKKTRQIKDEMGSFQDFRAGCGRGLGLGLGAGWAKFCFLLLIWILELRRVPGKGFMRLLYVFYRRVFRGLGFNMGCLLIFVIVG